MGNLSAFLAQNVVKEENTKYVVSERFVDEKKKPIPWEIKAISGTEDEALRKECTKRVPVPEKRGQYNKETDYNEYLAKLAVTCTVFPNLHDSELQDSYKAMGAEDLIRKMLLPGEYANYLEKVQEVNKFDISTDELVEEVKN